MDQTTPSLQEIQDKIRAAATAASINPDTALRIANAESVFSNTAKNTRSSARGLFQVIDQTWKDLGGDPNLRNDLDENIRIGIKAISNNRDAFLKKYGTEPDTKQLYGMHFLGPSQAIRVFNAAEDAAIKNIVPKKVIKANPFLDKMSVADFINFTQTKMDKKGTVTPATAVAKNEAPVPMPQAPKDMMREATSKKPSSRTVDLPTATNPTAPPMNRDLLASLGPSYQAALGAISLADSSEDDDEVLSEKYADMVAEQQGNELVPSTLGDIQLSYASPFEEPTPVQMATGGEVGVQKMAFGGIPYKPSALISSAVKNQVSTAQAALDAYNNQVNSYNSQLGDYSNKVNEYNTQAEAYRRQAEDYNNQVNSYNDQRGQYISSFVGGENPTVYISSRGQYRPAIGGGSMFATNASNINVIPYGKIAALNNLPGYYIRQGDYRTLGEPSAPGNAPTFSATAPNAPAQPTAPTQTVESANAAVAAAKEKQRRLQLTYDVMEDPERFNLSMPALFAEGGEALPELGSSASRDMQDYLNSSVSGNKDVLQGMVGGQVAEGIDARLIGTYMQSLPPKFAQQFLLNLEIAKKAGVNLNKEGVANIYANIANGDTNYQIGYSPTQKSVNLSRMDGNSGIGFNIGRDNVGLNYASRFATGGEASASDMLKQLKQAVVPAQIRTFLETVMMNKEDRAGRPITEKDFSESELRQILDTITTARKNRTAEKRYNDNYKPSAKEQKENDELFKKAFSTSDAALQLQREKMQAEKDYFQSGKGSVNYMDYPGFTSGLRDTTVSGKGAIRNTLGRFVYETLPDGRIRVKDTYDFKDDLVTELGQRPSAAYKDMGTMGKLGTILVDTLNNPMDLQSEEGGTKVGRATLPSRVGSAFIGQNGRPVDITLDPRELMPGYAGYAQGGPVYRAEGSPVYGEMADTGPITADTRAAMSNFQVPNAREALAALRKIYGEGASNAESLVRGSLAAVPGTFGDIGQEFDIRGLRELPTTEQLLKRYPQRLTQPTAETAKFENVGTYMPPPIPPSAVSGTAKAMMKGLKESGPQVENIMRKIAPAAEPFNAISREAPAGIKLPSVDALIGDYKTMVDNIVPRDSTKYKPLVDMLDKKAKDYFYNVYGTDKDPIRKATKNGEIPMFDMKTFAEYSDVVQKTGVSMRDLLSKARTGDKKAEKAFEDLYDKMTGLRKVSDKSGSEYYDLSGKFGAEFPFLSRGELIESLSTLPADQLNKLSFPEAVIIGTQNYLKKRDPSRGSNVIFFPKKSVK